MREMRSMTLAFLFPETNFSKMFLVLFRCVVSTLSAMGRGKLFWISWSLLEFRLSRFLCCIISMSIMSCSSVPTFDVFSLWSRTITYSNTAPNTKNKEMMKNTSRALTYETFGTDDLKEPISVTIVSTVVTTKATRAGTASFEIQKLNQERTTIRTVGV